jgi:uncharacterized protein (TIGR03435 family)
LVQTPDDSLTFEVASVKPRVPVAGAPTSSSMTGGPGTDDPGHITCSNRTLRTLIIEAYGIRGFQIEHPDWVGEARFDILAKVPRDATKQQARIMMRNLLAERFQLQIRREKRDLPVYALTAAKGGIKIKASAETTTENSPGIVTSYRDGRASTIASRQSISKLLTWLTGMVDRPVLDTTGLKGDYDFNLTWSPDYSHNGDPNADLFPAVQQQLGLKLEPRKMPIDMLIVVSARKVPVEN